MYKGKRILAIVPARGGSKGVPLKNIRSLAGVPLIAHTANVIREVQEIDLGVVSTDHQEIANAASKYGLSAPYLRPESIAGDFIGDWDVLSHGLRTCEELFKLNFDIVLMLQPTSPLRKSLTIRECIEKLVDENLDAVWTLTKTDLKFHPLKQLTLDANGRLDYFDSRGANIIARQQLNPVFHRNGACYAITKECLMHQKSILGVRAGGVVVDYPLVNIDTLEDFTAAEELLLTRQ